MLCGQRVTPHGVGNRPWQRRAVTHGGQMVAETVGDAVGL